VVTDFSALRTTWNRLGELDPLWAVLSDDAKKGGRWDLDEFFESGRMEVDDVMRRVDAAVTADGRQPLKPERALDFGCGVGRISQALRRHAGQVMGVDIADSMIRRARNLNRADNVRFQLSSGELLEQLDDDTFDLVYTAHVLQHMETTYQRRYVSEFFRILRPNGVAMLELVTEPVQGASVPLPDEAFQAELTILDAPSDVRPSQPSTVRVRLRNVGTHAWPSVGTDGWYLVTVGGHWWPVDQASGERSSAESRPEPARAPLPSDLAPGDAVELSFRFRAPDEPGAYRLALDPVQEGVDWFGNRGSTPAETPVIMVADRLGWRRATSVARKALGRVASQADEGPEPVMEMHGNPDTAIRDWIEEAGGRVLACFDWDEVSRSQSRDWQRRGYICVRERARA
jgi:SAM-dependent methyltransferase